MCAHRDVELSPGPARRLRGARMTIRPVRCHSGGTSDENRESRLRPMCRGRDICHVAAHAGQYSLVEG